MESERAHRGASPLGKGSKIQCSHGCQFPCPQPPSWVTLTNRGQENDIGVHPRFTDGASQHPDPQINVIIRKAQKAIQTGDRRPRRRSSSRFPLLAPTRDSLESRGPPPSLVFRTEDVRLRCNQFIETSEFSIRVCVSLSHSYSGRAGHRW